MKRSLLILTLFLGTNLAIAQNPVIRGEVSPGVYANVAVDNVGKLVTSSTSNSATAGAKLGGTAASMSTLVGGLFTANPVNLTEGQQSSFRLDSLGNVSMRIVDSDGGLGAVVANSSSDGISAVNAGLLTISYDRVFNGTTWDRLRGNTTGVFAVTRPTPGTMTDRSGTLTTASTSQQIMAVNANRRYLMIQNSSSAIMWCNFTTAATLSQPSFLLSVGASYVLENNTITTEAVNCISGTAANPFTAKEM